MKKIIASTPKTFVLGSALFIALSFFIPRVYAQSCGMGISGLDSNGTTSLTFETFSGQSVVQAVKIKNISTSAFQVWTRTSSTSPFSFKAKDSVINSLAPGATATVLITFTPLSGATGTGNGKLTITNASTLCKTVISLIGIVQPYLCLETEHELSYTDPVLVGGSAIHEFRLINNSGAAIKIPSVTIEDSVTSGFKIISSLPITVLPHSNNQFLQYSFSPESNYGGAYFNTPLRRSVKPAIARHVLPSKHC
jgi:hypothetical protein